MTYHVTIFGIHLNLNPVAFTLPIGKNGWPIYWYGIIIATGFLLAILYAFKKADSYQINKDRMMDVILVTTPLAIFCARAYYCIFENVDGTRISSVREFFGLDSSGGFQGLAIYGGVIGAFGIGMLMCRLRKVNIPDMFDLAATGFLIGQGIGRWGNFVNQEAFGTPTGSTWFGMSSEATGGLLVHPCFLYESIWCIAGFFLLNALSKKRKFRGQIFLTYGVWYGFGRFFIEMLRTDSLTVGKIRISVLVSALAVVICAAFLIVKLYRLRQKETHSLAAPKLVADEEGTEVPDEETDLPKEKETPAAEVLQPDQPEVQEENHGEDH